MSGNGTAPRPDEVARRLSAWDERSRSLADQEHLGQCVLLDDLCCGRLWGRMRQEDSHVTELVESLYGKDWWQNIPMSMRVAVALLAARNENYQHVAARLEELHVRFASEVDRAVKHQLRARRERP